MLLMVPPYQRCNSSSAPSVSVTAGRVRSVVAECLPDGLISGFTVGISGTILVYVRAICWVPSRPQPRLVTKWPRSATQVASLYPRGRYPNLNLLPARWGLSPERPMGYFGPCIFVTNGGCPINDAVPTDCFTVQCFRGCCCQVYCWAAYPLLSCQNGHRVCLSNVAPEPFRTPPICLSWLGLFYYNKCLAMGCDGLCKLFETFIYALEWTARHNLGPQKLLKYRMSFFFVLGRHRGWVWPDCLHVCSVLRTSGHSSGSRQDSHCGSHAVLGICGNLVWYHSYPTSIAARQAAKSRDSMTGRRSLYWKTCSQSLGCLILHSKW